MKIFKNINTLNEIPHFNVSKQPLFNKAGLQIPNLWSLTRDDSEQHIGICTDKYRPIQLDEMIDTISEACNRIHGDIKHTGFTENATGSQLVIRSEIGDLGLDKDPIDGYFYTIIDHRGKSSNRIVPSTLRIGCMNKFHLVKRENLKSDLPSLRHNMKFDERVEMFKSNITNSINAARAFTSIAENLQSKKFTRDEMVKLIENLIPKQKDESERTGKKREKILMKFGHGLANEGQTRWDAFNAITEFESYQKTSSTKFIRTLTMPTMSFKALEYLRAA